MPIRKNPNHSANYANSLHTKNPEKLTPTKLKNRPKIHYAKAVRT
jgi:hypothetical protein